MVEACPGGLLELADTQEQERRGRPLISGQTDGHVESATAAPRVRSQEAGRDWLRRTGLRVSDIRLSPAPGQPPGHCCSSRPHHCSPHTAPSTLLSTPLWLHLW